MNIYDLTNYNYNEYNYTQTSIKKTKQIAIIDRLSRLIIPISFLFFLLYKYTVNSISFNLVMYLLLIVTIISRLVGAIIYYNINKNLFIYNKEDYHDFEYYYYCKKRTKSTNSMHLINIINSNIEMGKYKDALMALRLLNINTNYIRVNKFNYLYYYAKCYKELGDLPEFERILLLLVDLKKKRKLNKKQILMLNSINNEDEKNS